VVFDPNRTVTLSAKTLHMKVDYNPYEGRKVTGAADTVLSRGRLVIEDGKFVGRAGSGSFLKRATRT
jgi:dihydropyrimidinase